MIYRWQKTFPVEMLKYGDSGLLKKYAETCVSEAINGMLKGYKTSENDF